MVLFQYYYFNYSTYTCIVQCRPRYFFSSVILYYNYYFCNSNLLCITLGEMAQTDYRRSAAC